MKLTQKLAEMALTIPPLSGPFGAYIPAKRIGNQLWISGQLPMKDGGLIARGQVPSRCAIESARAGARQCVINALSAASSVLSDLDEIEGVLRVGVFVSSDADFTEQPRVANGASELLRELLGELGQHARAAVGVNTLPLDAAVEVEIIFILRTRVESRP